MKHERHNRHEQHERHNQPIQTTGSARETPSGGIEPSVLSFHPTMTHKPTPWQAEWIWLNGTFFPCLQTSRPTVFCEDAGLSPALALFRREIRLDRPIRSARAWSSGDVKYRLFVNGEPVCRGPAEVGGDYGNRDVLGYWFYDGCDLSDRLLPGVNVLCAEVLLQPDVMADYATGHGGFLLEIEWVADDETTGIWKTDAGWKGIAQPAFLDMAAWDASGEPVGWHEAGFDDTAWPEVSVVERAFHEADVPAAGGSVRWPLIPREIPPLREEAVWPCEVLEPFRDRQGGLAHPQRLCAAGGAHSDSGDPAHAFPPNIASAVESSHPDKESDDCAVIPFGAPMTFWIDFGKIHAARLFLDVEGPAGTQLWFGFQEMAGRTERSCRFTLRHGRQTWEGVRLESARYLQVTASNLTGPVRLHAIRLHASGYPVAHRGAFSCSDPDLVQIYEAGRRSNQLCRQAYHLDSPIHQEALGCTGDYMIESLMNYATFGDPWLTRLDILRTARLLDAKDGVMFHTSYSLLWLEMLMDYHRFTGDAALPGQVARTAFRLLDRFLGYRGESGLVEHAPNYMFMDWVPLGEMNLHHPPRIIGQGYMTAFLIRALDNGANLARLVSDVDRADGYARETERMREVFHSLLWDGDRGLYRDGRSDGMPCEPNDWLPADPEGPFFSQHTNALAVLYGIAPEDQRASIMHRVFTDAALTQAQPYFLHFVLEAADAAGVFGTWGLPQIRRWNTLLAECPGSLKEVWSGFACDYSHAWGGTPTWQLPSKVLGIMPLEPGFARVRIRPCPGDLAWAGGRVPTPRGTIAVAWRRESTGSILRIHVPEGMDAIVDTSMLGETAVEWRTDAEPFEQQDG